MIPERVATPAPSTGSPTLYLETFLVSLAAILLEVSYTRVFSFKLVYYFTYLIIGIALLGLGAGGVFVALFPRLRRVGAARLVPACCVAAAAAVLGGYVLIARTQLNAFDLITAVATRDRRVALHEGMRLVLICTTLFGPFLAAGLALATIFATQTARINRLYFADLLGAGVGCAACIPLMSVIFPPGCVMLAGGCFALGGLRLALSASRPLAAASAGLAVALLAGAAFPSRLPEPVVDRVKTMSPQQHDPADVLFSRWSPVFRVDVLRVSYTADGLMLSHDGLWGSFIRRFEGSPASLAHYDRDERAHPFRVLAPAPRVAIIGAAGGNEILASLYFGAAHVTAIELNPVTVSLLTTHFSDFSGHLASRPGVELLNAEGRSFLARTAEHYDLIWYVAPDSYAAMNAATSGAFVLSESYLYTAETVIDSLERLTDGGVICTQFGEVDFENKPNRTLRYLATAREAFRRLGVADFDRHVLVATSPSFVIKDASTILLKRTPFTDAEVKRFTDSVGAVNDARVRFAWTQRDGERPAGPVSDVIALDAAQLERWYARYPFDVRPVSDDSPFFWHFVGFDKALDGSLRFGISSPEEGSGERLLLVLLVVATGFAAFFLLAPLLAVREVWAGVPYKGRAAIYFAALGLGFMFFEVSLIQRFTLFLGYPTYSLTVTLFALLASTAIGSLASERVATRRGTMLLALAGALVALVVLYQLCVTPLVRRGVGWPLAVRVLLTVGFVAPLGLCLGSFMPLGLRTVASLGRHGEEYVAWGWAVNGFFSVVSSVLATMLSMTFGFSAVMVAAVGVYLVGIAALAAVPDAPT